MSRGDSYFTVPFEMGRVVVWTGGSGEVEGLSFDLDGTFAPRVSRCRLACDLERYFRGEDVAWEPGIVSWTGDSFRDRVYDRVARIPYGRVLYYGQVAAEAGRPGGARAVGGAMAANRFPIIVPCHRVVGARGSLGGFSSGLELKRFLLRLEGVAR